MRSFRDLSIRYKLTLLLVSVVGIVLMGIALTDVLVEWRATRARMIVRCSTLAKIVAAQSGAALSIADIDPRGAQEIVSDLAVEPSHYFAALYDSSGHEVARHPLDSLLPKGPPPPRGATFTGDGFLDVVDDVMLDDGTVVGQVFLRHRTDQLRREVWQKILIVISGFVVAEIVALLLAFVLQRFITAPILQLVQLMERVSAKHDYSLRAEKEGNDELGLLTDGFNTMLAEVRRRDEELEKHRANLEREVEQRTRVLQARTDELTASNAQLARSREALQAANKELEAFSYSVSHDLRAPLRAIDGFSRILLQDYVESLPPEAQEFLQDIRANTQQMGHLVDDLLDFSRLSRLPIQKETVAADELVQLCLKDLQAEQEGRNLDIRLGELPACSADPALLKQVWLNLLSNALKYTRKCERAVIEVGSQNGDPNVGRTYYVADNGVGFDMRYAHKLFGVFQRLHKAEEFPGTGVGLAIVQRIVHRHGGRIWAQSQPGKGTTFYFTLAEGAATHG